MSISPIMNTPSSSSISNAQLRDVVYRSCLFMDEADYNGFLALCTDSFRYIVSAHTPELLGDAVLFDKDRAELEIMFNSLPQHIRLPGDFLRHATVYSIERSNSDDAASVVTSVTVVHTDYDGQSRIFAAGRYYDLVVWKSGRPLLQERHTKLRTRDLRGGAHVPV
jgi:methanesulfonate monooxygenase small subunit